MSCEAPTVVDVMDLKGMVGTVFGPSEWMVVDQGRIDRFAAVSGDRQWIHVDVARARRGASGGTIAHGNLTLALITPLFGSLVTTKVGEGRTVNYGYDRVRFLAPVPAGSRIRLLADLTSVEDRDSGVLVDWKFTVESDCHDRPALVANKLQLIEL